MEKSQNNIKETQGICKTDGSCGNNNFIPITGNIFIQ